MLLLPVLSTDSDYDIKVLENGRVSPVRSLSILFSSPGKFSLLFRLSH